MLRLIIILIALSLEGTAARGNATIMAYGLTPEQARTFLNEHSQLQPIVPIAEILDQRERIAYIEGSLQQPLEGHDVNLLLRRTNRMFDELVSAMKQSRYVERKVLIAGIETDLKQKIANAHEPIRFAVALSTRPNQALAESRADVFFSLFIPACFQADSAQTRTEVRRDLVRIGFALTAYRGEKGSYPETLDELVPKYLPEIPLDKFSEKPLIYVPRESDFLIYSVGNNGLDDEGRRMGSNGKDDDVALEVPPKIE
jgi:hypothetical protein